MLAITLALPFLPRWSGPRGRRLERAAPAHGGPRGVRRLARPDGAGPLRGAQMSARPRLPRFLRPARLLPLALAGRAAAARPHAAARRGRGERRGSADRDLGTLRHLPPGRSASRSRPARTPARTALHLVPRRRRQRRGREVGAPGNGFRGAIVAARRCPALCARCHSDEKRMRPYDLPVDQYDALPDVARTASGSRRATRAVAVCSDCHGTHDILAPSPTRRAACT